MARVMEEVALWEAKGIFVGAGMVSGSSEVETRL